MADPPKEYSRAFDTFVRDHEDDVAGLLAYALYKQRKREWLISHKEKNGGQEPTADQLATYEQSMLIPLQVDDLRANAVSVLAAYADGALEEQRPDIEKQAISQEVLGAREDIRNSASFINQLLQALIASVVTTAVLVLLAIAIGIFGIDLVDGGRAVSNALGSAE